MAFKLKAGKAVSNLVILKEGFAAMIEIIDAEQGLACKEFLHHSYNAIMGDESLDDTFRARMGQIARAKRVIDGAGLEVVNHPEPESARLKRMAREAMAS